MRIRFLDVDADVARQFFLEPDGCFFSSLSGASSVGLPQLAVVAGGDGRKLPLGQSFSFRGRVEGQIFHGERSASRPARWLLIVA
jgi:hypothetical protein